MVHEEDGPFPQRPRVGDLARQRLAPVEEGVAPLPGQTQELVEEDLAGIALSVAHDHRRAGEMRDIGVRKAAEHGGVQDGARGLRADGHVHDILHGLARRGVHERARHHGQPSPDHDGLDLAVHRPHERPGRPLGRLAHVDVWIGPVAGEDGGVVDHGRRHVGVEIEPDGEGQVGRHRANAAEELALAVVDVLGDHGAVQRQEGRVAAVPDPAHDGLAHVLVGRPLHVARRMRAGREGYHDLCARLLGHVQEAAQLGIGVLELLDGRGTGEGAERGQGRGDGRKRIGLVHHHRDENLAAGHGPSSQVSRMGYAARAYRRLGGCAVPHRGQDEAGDSETGEDPEHDPTKRLRLGGDEAPVPQPDPEGDEGKRVEREHRGLRVQQAARPREEQRKDIGGHEERDQRRAAPRGGTRRREIEDHRGRTGEAGRSVEKPGEASRREGGRVSLTQEPEEAVTDADCVVADTWVSMGVEASVNRHNLLAPYRVDERLMAKAKPDAIFMHCLPAKRGEEVTAGVIDGPQSVVWDEAENRLHVQKGILAWCLA